MNSGDSGMDAPLNELPMRLDYGDYIKLLLKYFKEKQAEGKFPMLSAPTPGNIRKECVAVYKERFDRRDLPILRAFFGPFDDQRPLEKIIQKFDLDKFKPLVNYLKGKTDDTEDKNLYLLAWLIDFQPRPFRREIEWPNDDKQPDTQHEPDDGPRSEEPGTPSPMPVIEPKADPKDPGPTTFPVPDPPKGDAGTGGGGGPKKTDRKRRMIVAFLLGAAGLGTGYLVWDRNGSHAQIQGIADFGCMYWADTVYVAAPCNNKVAGRELIALDPNILKNLRRITQPDTITARSIGRIYYIQNDHQYQFFTTSGDYPENRKRSLRKLSQRIFDNHQKKIASAKAQ